MSRARGEWERVSPDGMISQASPATKRFPIVQKAAMKLSIDPRFAFGWNSAKYDQITGPLPPNLKASKLAHSQGRFVSLTYATPFRNLKTMKSM